MERIDYNKVQACVEALCDEGCRAVRDHIERLAAGDPPTPAADLSGREQAAVLEELRDIMAVYGARCDL